MARFVFAAGLWAVLVFSTLTHASPFAPFAIVHPVQDSILTEREQPLVEVRVPEAWINQILKEHFGSVPFVEEFQEVDIAPVEGLITFRAKLAFPEGKLLGVSGITSSEAGYFVQPYDFVFSFQPRIWAVGKQTYLRVQLVRLELGGVDLMKAVPLALELLKKFFATAQLDRFLNRASNEGGSSEKTLRIDLGNQVIQLQLDPEKLISLPKGYEPYLGNLRVWAFRPALNGDTGESVLYLAVGNGVPKKNIPTKNPKKFDSWLDLDRRKAQEQSKVLAAKKTEAFEVNWGGSFKPQDLVQRLDVNLEAGLQSAGLPADGFQAREIERFKRGLRNGIPPLVSEESIAFRSDPERTVHEVEELKQQEIDRFIDQLNERASKVKIVKEYVAGSGPASLVWPFLEKRISQKTITGLMNYLRDISMVQDSRFRRIDFQLKPSYPGFILHGVYRVSLDRVIFSSEENSDQDVPFALHVRTLHQNDGWLRLDILRLELFGPKNPFLMDRLNPIGTEIVQFAEDLLGNSLAKLAFGSQGGSKEELEKKEKEKREKLFESIHALKTDYEQDLEDFSDFIRIDVEKNPFLEEGKERAKSELAATFAHHVRYDGDSLLVSVDPTMVKGEMPYVRDNLRVWNFEPIFWEEQNQFFLDLSLGTHKRSVTYNNYLHSRPERSSSIAENQEPVGSEAEAIDLHIAANLKDFTAAANQMYEKATAIQRAEAQEALKKEEASSHYLTNRVLFQISSEAADELEVFYDMTVIEKYWSKPFFLWSWFGAKGKWKTKQYEMNMGFRFKASTVELEEYGEVLANNRDKVFLGDRALRLDLTWAKYVNEDFKWLNTLLKLVGIDVADLDLRKGLVAKWVKAIARRILAPMLDDPENPGNTVLAGVHFNKFARIYMPKPKSRPEKNGFGDVIVQVNPRISGAALDLRLIRPEGSEDQGVIIDGKNNKLILNFSVKSGMANTDKRELWKIYEETEAIFQPYLVEENTDELVKMLESQRLYNEVFYNSDSSKASLYHRYIYAVSQYPEVVLLSEEEQSEIAKLFPKALEKSDGTWSSECGVELAYFSGALLRIYVKLSELIEKIDQLELTEEVRNELEKTYYVRHFREKRTELKERFLIPLLERYETDHFKKNKQIITQGVTDWTVSFYPDALFADRTMKFVMEEAKAAGISWRKRSPSNALME